MGNPYAMLYDQDNESLTFSVGIAPITLNLFTLGISNGIDFVADYGFRITIPRVYRVEVAASFEIDNGAEFNMHLYKNDATTPFGSHSLGLTSIRNNLSFAALLDLNVADTLIVKASSNADGRTLTMYDCQFIVAGV